MKRKHRSMQEIFSRISVITAGALVLLGSLAVYSNAKSSALLQSLRSNEILWLKTTGELTTEIALLASKYEVLTIPTNPNLLRDLDQSKKLEAQIQEKVESLRSKVQSELIVSTLSVDTIGALRSSFKALEEKLPLLKEAGKEMVLGYLSGENSTGQTQEQKVEQLREEVSGLSASLSSGIEDLVDESIKSTVKLTSLLTSLIIGFTVICGAASIFGVTLLLRNMRIRLHGVSENLDGGIEALTHSATGLDKTSYALEQVGSEQSTATDAVTSAAATMSSVVKQVVAFAKNCLDLAHKTQAHVNSGQNVMERLETAMEGIDGSKIELSEIITMIDEIKTKTMSVNEINLKTQLLAFNASIEATKAGRHGQGFSVIATQVGELAQVSAEVATAIGSLVDKSYKRTEEILNQITEKIASGHQVSRESIHLFSEIQANVKNLSSATVAIVDSMDVQRGSIEDTGRAMNQMEGVSKKTQEITQKNRLVALAVEREVSLLLTNITSLRGILIKSEGSETTSKDLFSPEPPGAPRELSELKDRSKRVSA